MKKDAHFHLVQIALRALLEKYELCMYFKGLVAGSREVSGLQSAEDHCVLSSSRRGMYGRISLKAKTIGLVHHDRVLTGRY